jgi:hemerythrin superfamily protein
MATTKKTKAAKASVRTSRPKPAPAPGGPQDAVSLLEADHREVEALFEEYEAAGGNAEKAALAAQICLALKVHAQIEEELFYPPARDKTGDTDLVDEAIVEHMGAKTLIAQIEAMAPGQPLYDAKVKVLSEQVRHHVEEEESDLFPEVRETRIDLDALGAKLAARKAELLDLLTSMSAQAVA